MVIKFYHNSTARSSIPMLCCLTAIVKSLISIACNGRGSRPRHKLCLCVCIRKLQVSVSVQIKNTSRLVRVFFVLVRSPRLVLQRLLNLWFQSHATDGSVRDTNFVCVFAKQTSSLYVRANKKHEPFGSCSYCFGAVTETWTRTGSPYAPQTYASAYSAMTAHSLLIIWLNTNIVKDFWKVYLQKFAFLLLVVSNANLCIFAYSQVWAKSGGEKS